MRGSARWSASVYRTMLLCACVLASALAQSAAQAAAPPQGTVHYHFGDDPDGAQGWAGRSFDDRAWPVVEQGGWPAPAYDSDGFAWVRFRAPVRSDASEPLAIRLGNPRNVPIAEEVFVNGTSVGSFGDLPPHAWVNSLPQDTVFDVPVGLAQPGTMASIVVRLWYPPFARSSPPVPTFHLGRRGVSLGRSPAKFTTISLTFDQRRTLHAEQEAASSRALLRNLPGLLLNGLIFLIGFSVLWLARSSGSRDLRLYGAMLASFPWITIFIEIVTARLVALSVQEYFVLQVLSELPVMIVTVVFIWGINRLGAGWLKNLAMAIMWIFNICIVIAFVPEQPSVIAAAALPVSVVTLKLFNAITLGALLYVFFIVRRKRLIAFAMSLPPIGSLAVGFRVLFQQGQEAFDIAFFLAGLFLSVSLAIEAWKEWRARDGLQAEFEAAREMQQQLVRPAAEAPGFRIESVYEPATQVGGDFFRVVPESDGSVLVVVGDVSGKGLKAALTVSAMIGALRTMPQLPPARILTALNRGLIGQMQAGFVTCCVARIDIGGAVTLANAGHLAPYCNGEELEVPPGLPLGLNPDAFYEETAVWLAPDETLTFVSDGVVEARDGKGNLFGFDRTRRLSSRSAQEIGEAAQRFGQQDDITVLTVAFAPAVVAVS
ncbi:MAG TPA: SpoIIE family protein phosphatase [Acidobacteriaceae bacterium]